MARRHSDPEFIVRVSYVTDPENERAAQNILKEGFRRGLLRLNGTTILEQRVADLATGTVRQVALVPELQFATNETLLWNGGGFFSPDGRWMLFTTGSPADDYGPWGEVGVVDAATGAVRTLGEGLPVGWTSDGQALIIRWENWRSRYAAYE